jgi:hypothetical protein
MCRDFIQEPTDQLHTEQVVLRIQEYADAHAKRSRNPPQQNDRNVSIARFQLPQVAL